MNYDELTTEAQSVLLTLYKAYYDRIKQGESRNTARRFLIFDDIHKEYFEDWDNSDDLLDIFRELGKSNWVDNTWGSNTIAYTDLSTKAIAHLQRRFSKGISQAINTLSDLKKILF